MWAVGGSVQDKTLCIVKDDMVGVTQPHIPIRASIRCILPTDSGTDSVQRHHNIDITHHIAYIS